MAEARKQPIARILATVPGLGPIRVAQLLPIVVTPLSDAPPQYRERPWPTEALVEGWFLLEGGEPMGSQIAEAVERGALTDDRT